MDSDYRNAPLAAIPEIVWSLLDEGVHQSASFFHTPALATHGTRWPETRTVVLRGATFAARQLVCHTDCRSAKRFQIETNPRVCWMFYDRARKLQIRLYGQAHLHEDTELARVRWQQSSRNSRKCYSAPLSPGTPVARPGEATEDADSGWPNFCVLVSEIESIDWLHLNSAGHRRAQLFWQEGDWIAKWVSP